MDLTLLNRYNTVVLYGLNEYFIELYKYVLPKWTGGKIILCGDWAVLGYVLPSISGKEIFIQKDYFPGSPLEINEPLVLHVMDFLPKNEDYKRFDEDNIIMIDELMTYTFCFSDLQHFGNEYPDKKFLIIDGSFRIEGIFGIQSKVFTMVKYAITKGYIPVVIILSSDNNMYSDGFGDDIWSKFMNQPCGYTIKDIKNAKNVYISPNANCLTIMRHIMEMETDKEIVLDTDKKLFCQNVEDYINANSQIVPEPSQTLGVLIRGTDYTKTHMPGHPIHASVSEIVTKISEIEAEHPYKYIYLATEDSEILEEMKSIYGNRLLYTDQERFSIDPGQLLINIHDARPKEKGKGFRLGAEYLLTLRLLSKCESLVASGNCGGTDEAIRENNGNYRITYVFNKGINSRN
ncbi:MAG: hypothetical protein K6A23_02065 [Butyrivibrio sp.]|nr:hypothetical protein [Butyrivibrio sp.]